MEIPIRRYSTWIVHFSSYKSTTSSTSSSSRFSRMAGTWVHSFSGVMLAETLVYLVLIYAGWRWAGKFSRFSRFSRFPRFSRSSRMTGTWVHSFFSCYAGQDIGLLSFSVIRLALDWQGHGSILRC